MREDERIFPFELRCLEARRDDVSLYSGAIIITVPAGTVIEHQDQSLTVTDDSAVCKGRTIYVTQLIYDQIKQATTPQGDAP